MTNKPISPRWDDFSPQTLDALARLIEQKSIPPEIDITALSTEKGRLELAYIKGRNDVYREIMIAIKHKSNG